MRARVGRTFVWVWMVLVAASGAPLHLAERASEHVCGDECSCASFEGSGCCAQAEPEPTSCCADAGAPGERPSGLRLVPVEGCSCHGPSPNGLTIAGPPRLSPDTADGLPAPLERGRWLPIDRIAFVSCVAGLGFLGLLGGGLPAFRIYDVPLGGPALDLVVMPLDANPTPDAAVLVRTAPSEVGLMTLRGNGAGRLTPVDLQLLAQTGYVNTPTLAADDLNGDALPDLTIAAISDFQIYLGDGDLSYVGMSYLPTAGGSQHGLDLSDYDGDGDLDSILLVDDIFESYLDIGTNDGSGSLGGVAFEFVADAPAQDAFVLCADLDGDGVDTVFVIGASGLWSLGEWGGPEPDALLVAEGPESLRQIVAADLNADGAPDLAVSSRKSGGVFVLLNDGAGLLGAPTFFATGRGPEALAAGDLTGDGLVDLVVPNRRDDDAAVLAGDGTGAFQLAGSFALPARPVRIGLTDLDLDGDLDVLAASAEGASLRVALSQRVP